MSSGANPWETIWVRLHLTACRWWLRFSSLSAFLLWCVQCTNVPPQIWNVEIICFLTGVCCRLLPHWRCAGTASFLCSRLKKLFQFDDSDAGDNSGGGCYAYRSGVFLFDEKTAECQFQLFIFGKFCWFIRRYFKIKKRALSITYLKFTRHDKNYWNYVLFQR